MRRTSLIAMAMISLLVLSGCFKMNMDLKVDSDGTIDGTIVFAVDEQLAEMADDSETNLFEEEDVPPGVEVEPYKADGLVGQKATLTDVPLEKLNETFAEEEGGEFGFTHQGDEFVFTADMKMAEQMKKDQSAGGAEGMDPEFAAGMEQMMQTMLKDAEFKVSITFPGDIKDTNGKVDGNTVTWDVDLTKDSTLKAVAADSGSSALGGLGGDGDGFPVVPAAIGAAILVALAGGGVFLARRKSAAPAKPIS